MKKTLTLLLLSVFSLSAFAQFPGGPPFGGGWDGGRSGGNRGESEKEKKPDFYVAGTVLDEKNEPMVAVSVSLLNAKDSVLVSGMATMTDAEGAFMVGNDNLRRGEYLVRFTFLGYKPLYKAVKLLNIEPVAKLGSVKMEPDAIMLKEAVVEGVVPPIVTKEDTIEYNADSFKTQPNAVAEDLFKKLPGVEIDENGNITAQGKSVKKILVDGKEFFTDDPKVASKNLPANMIDKVQVVDRKSDEARFSGVDDGEEETIINLTVKKGMKQGWFGTAQAGGGTEMQEWNPMYELNAMANRFINSSQFSLLGSYNNTNNQGAADLGQSMFSGSSRMMSGGGNRGTGKSGMLGGNFNTGNDSETFRIGGDVSYMHADRYTESKSEQQNFLTNDSSSFVNSRSENIHRSNNLRLNFRMRWEIDTLTSLEFMPRFDFNKSHMESNSYSETMGGHRDALLADRDSVNDRRSDSGSDGQGYNFSGRLSFSRAFKNDPRRRFSFSFNYSTNRNEENGETRDEMNFYRLGVRDSLRNQKDDNISQGASYSARVTYVEPLSKHYYLNFVYQYRYNSNNGDAYTYNIDEDGNYAELDTLGNPIADTTYSNVSRSRYQTHRGEISLRGVYSKMNFNVGVNLENQHRETHYLFGKNVGNDISTYALNFSPTFRLRYRITKNKNLRINYRGNSSQPSARQLQEAPDITNPLNVYVGDRGLKSSFNHRAWLRYDSYNPDTYQALNVNLEASTTQNNITEMTIYTTDGGRIRTPVNVNGEWNANARVFYNMPFKRNKKFSFNSNTNIRYNNSVGFIALGYENDGVYNDIIARAKNDDTKNISRNYTFGENLSLRYSSDVFNASIGGNYNYSLVTNTLQTDNNQSTMDFGANVNIDWFLPCGLSFGTDCRYRGTAGYAEGYNQHKVNWNASIAYSFLAKKNATIRFKVYDILQQNTNIDRSVSGTYIRDSETNALGSYCMLYFAYQFNTIGKGGGDERRGGRGGFGGGPRGYDGF